MFPLTAVHSSRQHLGARSRVVEEKLYHALRAEHAKAEQPRRTAKNKLARLEPLPKSVRDLEVKKKEDTGQFHYAFD